MAGVIIWMVLLKFVLKPEDEGGVVALLVAIKCIVNREFVVRIRKRLSNALFLTVTDGSRSASSPHWQK